MRAILFHTKTLQVLITGLAKRPGDVVPEPIQNLSEEWSNCIAVFITIEENDSPSKIQKMARDIEKMSVETDRVKIILVPFAHLSSKLAKSDTALARLNELENLIVKKKLKVSRAHFGSDKELLIHIFGNTGNARYREY